MANPVHGHDVMQMMIEAGRPYSREGLRAAIVERFGADATFYTCSAEDMSPDELITFLAMRGKLLETTDGWSTDADAMCRH